MKKITIYFRVIVLLIFCSASVNLSAQSGDFEFLFNADGDTEGWVLFTDGSISVASGNLTYTYGSSTSGFQLNPPSTDIFIEKANYPYLAIKLSHKPLKRTYMYCKVNGVGGWYGNKSNPTIDDQEISAANVFYYDLSGANFPDATLADGKIDRLIFNLEDETQTSVDVEWIKTFASIASIKAYITANDLSEDVNKIQTKIISGSNKIDLHQCELNSKIEVFDISGKLVKSVVASSSEVSITCDKGLYIVRVSGTSVSSKKVVVY